LTAGDNSRGVALVDFDRDGDVDVLITNQHGPVTLLRNSLVESGAKPRWIGLELAGNGRDTARSAVGSRIEVRYQEGGKLVTQFHEVHLVNGFSGHEGPWLHLGLGKAEGPVDVTVTWQGSGRTTAIIGLTPGKVHALAEP